MAKCSLFYYLFSFEVPNVVHPPTTVHTYVNTTLSNFLQRGFKHQSIVKCTEQKLFYVKHAMCEVCLANVVYRWSQRTFCDCFVRDEPVLNRSKHRYLNFDLKFQT